ARAGAARAGGHERAGPAHARPRPVRLRRAPALAAIARRGRVPDLLARGVDAGLGARAVRRGRDRGRAAEPVDRRPRLRRRRRRPGWEREPGLGVRASTEACGTDRNRPVRRGTTMKIGSVCRTLLCSAALVGCAAGTDTEWAPSATPEEIDAAASAVTASELLEQIGVLSSDEFEGRSPGTPGEDRTIEYLTEQFRALGLQPGNPDGTYVQEVPLVGFTTQSVASLSVGGRTIPLRANEDYVAVSRHFQPTLDL